MKILKFSLLIFILSLTSCFDEYIDDYETTSMGFAVANPLRTVIADRDMSVYVGVSIGGKREVNTKDWAKFKLDATLLEGTRFELLPADYYTLGDNETMRVRKSNMPVADVEIKFTDAFYADEKTLGENYALPFRITESSTDEVRADADSSIVVIKYISSYSGTYYVLGECSELDAAGNVVATETYNEKDLVDNFTRSVGTLGRKVLLRNGIANLAANDANRMNLTIGSAHENEGDYNVEVSTADGGVTIIQGSGKYTAKGKYTFNSGDTPAPEMDLNYEYELDGKRYKVTEKLVLRRDPLDDLRVETWN